MSKTNIKRQLGLLYISNFLFNSSIAGAAWVLLLVSDGYSLIQVGFAETVFHIVSLMAEIPSGMFADVFGRKKSLILSCVMTMCSALIRGFVPGLLLSVYQSDSQRFPTTSSRDATALLHTIRSSKKGSRAGTTGSCRPRL